jgi:hypothetical protein
VAYILTEFSGGLNPETLYWDEMSFPRFGMLYDCGSLSGKRTSMIGMGLPYFSISQLDLNQIRRPDGSPGHRFLHRNPIKGMFRVTNDHTSQTGN